MRFPVIRWVCISLLIAGLLTPAAAAAPLLETEEVEPAMASVNFRLEGGNGYRITVYASSERVDGQGRIYVSVFRPGSSVIYSARATVTEEYARADLGSLGRIDLAIHPSGRQTTVRIRCSPQAYAFEPVTYEGIVEFRGERGYTSAEATQVPARPPVTNFCISDFGETSGPDEAGARLRGRSYANGRRLTFQVNRNNPHARTLIRAELKERREIVFVRRAVKSVAPASAFRFDPNLRSAHLSPPAPFSGAATFTRDPNTSPRWTGNLTLDFPGRPNVRLTGPKVDAHLTHAHHTGSFKVK